MDLGLLHDYHMQVNSNALIGFHMCVQAGLSGPGKHCSLTPKPILSQFSYFICYSKCLVVIFSRAPGKMGFQGYLRYFFSSLMKICCYLSLEPSRRDGSNEGSQHIFLLKNKKIFSLNHPQ